MNSLIPPFHPRRKELEKRIEEEREEGNLIPSHGTFLTPTEDSLACDMVDALMQE